MNNKILLISLTIAALVLNNPLRITAKNPLDVLGLDEDATDRDIKKRCRELQTKFHTDKGGSNAKSTDINNACDDLDWRNKDDCKVNNKPTLSSCDCLTGTKPKSQCMQGFTDSSIRCDCPLSDGTNQSDSSNQFQGNRSKKSKPGNSSSYNKPSGSSTKYNNHDGCFYESQPCMCSNSGQFGTCDFGPVKTGLYCQCPQSNQQSGSSSSSNKSSKQPPVQDECEKPGSHSGTTCTCPNTGNKGQCGYNSSTSKYECKCSNDTCENNSLNAGKDCNCPNGNKGTCNYHWSDNMYRCQCSDDDCENNSANFGMPCHCSDTGKTGTCYYGSMKNGKSGYRCDCPSQQTRSANYSSSNNDFTSMPEFDPIKKYDSAVLYSANITAPIYNLPLQRTMTPTSNCHDWWFSVAPFTQQMNTWHIETTDIGHFDINNTEGGLIINLGYYAPWWYIRSLSSLAGAKTTSNKIVETEAENKFRFGLFDTLIAIGLRTDQDACCKVNGELFIGASDQRVKDIMQKHIVNMPSLGTGIQGNFDCVVSENCSTKYELSLLSRFTYFAPIKLTLSEALDKHEFGTAHYSPGAFIDLFFAFKQYYQYGGQFIIDMGYNPTFHVMKESTKLELNDSRAQLNVFTEKIPAVRHTIYWIYGYNWDADSMPMNISVGCSATFGQGVDLFGTFFATFGLGF